MAILVAEFYLLFTIQIQGRENKKKTQHSMLYKNIASITFILHLK